MISKQRPEERVSQGGARPASTHPYLLRLLPLDRSHFGDRALSGGRGLLPGPAAILHRFGHQGCGCHRHAPRAAQGRTVRQGRRGFRSGTQPGLVHLPDLGLPRAVLPRQSKRDVSVRHGVPPGEVLALSAALGEIFHAAVAGATELEVLTVTLASGAGSA